MTTHTIQDYIFKRIREMLPQTDSMPEIVSAILHISTDSAYRRIRGETLLVIDEAAVLCKHFNISLDQLLEFAPQDVLLKNVRINNHDITYKKYLENLYLQMQGLHSLPHKEIIYMSKDLPIFHNFYFEPLIAFRYFFWMKFQLMHPDFEKEKFSLDMVPGDIEKLSKDLLQVYCTIPSTEMWNSESINSVISQLEFSRDAGHFSSTTDIKLIYEALEQSIYHIKEQAASGYKFMPGEKVNGKEQNYKLFFNRVVLGDNSIIVITNSTRTAYINYGNLNYLESKDEKFCSELYHDFENLIRRSTQLSHSSERQRNIFFNILLTKIQDRKQNL